MIDLQSIADRYGLPIDGQSIPAGNGRLVAFGANELAYTTSLIDEPARAAMRIRFVRHVCRSDRGVTVAFPPGRLADVLNIMARAEGAAA
jgi:hypothetical protein